IRCHSEIVPLQENYYSSSKSEEIQRVFMQASCVKLTKSYRSTFEIMQFAQGISPNLDLVAIERHGEAPQILKCRKKAEEIERIYQLIHTFSASAYHTLGI